MTLEVGVKELAEAVAVDVRALEDGKVDKELGKGLSDTSFTQAEKDKLSGVAVGATKNRADSENADKVHTHTTAQVTGLDAALVGKVDKVSGKGLSDTNFTQVEKTKLDGIATGATKNRSDSENADKVHVHTTAQITGLDTTLGSKVDKVDGKGLSDTNFTQAEKNKLSSLEGSKFVGLFVSESALPATGSVGDYANVDGGVGSDVYRVIWDSSDNKWVRVKGVSVELTGAQIKQQYESNPDTNAFTDVDKTKLTGIATGATKNRADTLNADKTHTHTMAQVAGLDAALSGKADNTDPRFTDAREWSATTVSQLVAETGTSTDRLAFTPQRIRQSGVATVKSMTVQTTGQSTTDLMSQKAVTDAINNSTVGVGQTRQDMTASRKWGTIYTNPTGKTIEVFISSYANTAGANVGLFVDDALVDGYIAGAGSGILMSAEVPAGSHYSSGSDPAGAVTLITWSEMK